MLNHKNYSFLFQPLAASFLSTTAFFLIIFSFFRPGYATNDDISLIALASGYLSGKPLPFLVYSNVLLGFIVNPFYQAYPKINWEIFLFVLVNFFSTWALVHVFLSRWRATSLKVLATTAILLCDAYFLTNITYTTIAAFASLSGLCLVLTASQSNSPLNKNFFVFGFALALVGSLIRLKAMLLIILLILPVLILCFRVFHLKRLASALVVLGVLVSSGYIFNVIYLQSFPAWYSYQAYDSLRSELHDTPRKMNIGTAFTQVGWSKNDLKMFFNWFFPDKNIYSYENLQYLVEHVSDKQKSVVEALLSIPLSLSRPVSLPYVWIALSILSLMLIYGLSRKAILPLSVLLLSFFSLSFYLTWALKIPDRIMVPLLASVAIFGLCVLDWSGLNGIALSLQPQRDDKFPKLGFVSIALLVVAFGMVLYQEIETTRINIEKQAAYQNILIDLQYLQQSGKISQKALIISPAFGFPFEWSNPLTLNYPDIQFLEMGWLTFSPAYEQVLRAFGAQSMPAALYEKSNVYLMAQPALMGGIQDFIKEHEGFDVNANVIYQIPNTDVKLYKLQLK